MIKLYIAVNRIIRGFDKLSIFFWDEKLELVDTNRRGNYTTIGCYIT